MKNILRYIPVALLPCFFFLFSSILISCEKEVEVEMPAYDPVIVVNSFFETDSVARVEVLFSRSITDTTTIRTLKTAEVNLYENDVFSGRMLLDTTDRYSLAGFKPVAGRNYKLKVTVNGFKDVEAQTTIPSPTPVNSFTVIKGAGTDFNNQPLARLSINFNDPAEKNFYYVRMNYSRIDTFYIDSVNYTVYPGTYDLYLDPGSSDNNGENYINGAFMTTDELFNGKNYTLNLNFPQFAIDDSSASVNFFFSTISEEYYKYFRTLYLQQATSFNPFAEPVRVYSNINNGLGIFGSVTTQKYKIQ